MRGAGVLWANSNSAESKLQKALLLRIASIAFLMLLLLIPLVMIGGIVGDRQQLQRQVEDTVAGSFAGPQRLVGPLLVIPYVEREIAISTDESGRERKRTIEHQRQVLFATHSRDLISQVSPQNMLYLSEGNVTRLQMAMDMNDKNLVQTKTEELNDISRPYAERIMDMAIGKAMKGSKV